MRIALISNVTTSLLASRLRHGHDVVETDGFDNWIQQCLNPGAGLYAETLDSSMVILDGGSLFPEPDNEQRVQEQLRFVYQAFIALIERTRPAPVFISTIDIRSSFIKPLSQQRFEHRIEEKFYEMILEIRKTYNNVYILDIKKIVEEIGRESFYDDKMMILGGMPYSLMAQARLTDILHPAGSV